MENNMNQSMEQEVKTEATIPMNHQDALVTESEKALDKDNVTFNRHWITLERVHQHLSKTTM